MRTENQMDLFRIPDECIPKGVLLHRPAPAQAHSTTSRAAAASISGSASVLRNAVLAFIRAAGSRGATDEEVQVGLNMNPSTQRPRRVELWDAGLVRPSDEKRPTRSGRNAQVWVAV